MSWHRLELGVVWLRLGLLHLAHEHARARDRLRRAREVVGVLGGERVIRRGVFVSLLLCATVTETYCEAEQGEAGDAAERGA